MGQNMGVTSRAAVFDPDTKRFEHNSYELPDLLSGEVTIRVTCCTICGSDIHTFSGRRSGPRHCVLGHEIIGTVESWGGSQAPSDFFGNPIAKGMRVTWSIAVGCGACFFCQHGIPQKCDSLFKYGHESVGDRGATGGLAEYCTLLPGTAIFPVPDSLSDQVACPVNCATATVAAAFRLAEQIQPIEGSSVLITGIGMLGLTACAMSCEKSATSIIAVDINTDRLEMARKFGATHCVLADDDVLSDQIRGITDGRGADVALEFAGVTPATKTCMNSLRMGGTLILAGSVFPGEELRFTPEEMVRRMLTMRGIHNYAPHDLATAIEFLEGCHLRYPFEELVERSFDLSETENAFVYSRDQQPIRVAVTSRQK